MKAKYILLLIFCLLTRFTIQAQVSQLDSLLNIIDNAIDNSARYVEQKEQRITLLRAELEKAVGDNSRYYFSYRLYNEYEPFINDSAVYFINQCIALAIKNNQTDRVNECRSLLALRCSNTGMYDESLHVLSTINEAELTNNTIGIYYYAQAHVYGELAYYTHLADMKEIYGKKAYHYRQLMFNALPYYNKNRMVSLELQLQNEGKFKESMNINTKWLKHIKKGSHEYALVTLFRYLEYKNVNDTTNMMLWLAESVITDIRNAVMDQGSMWEMANQLMIAGDVDRAYKYINFTSDCANRFGSRQRLTQISPLLAEIAKMYKAESQKNYSRLRITVIVISVLALLLLASLVYVTSQRKRLAITRDNLAQSNGMLSQLNSQLKDSNTQLYEANRVKEEYVGRFMQLCSIYVDRLDSLRKLVNKRVKNKQYEELYEMTRSSEFKERELEELYSNFDTAFLHLFPHFVDDFNNLLKPEERIVLTNKEHLNTTIRIFALIRLGIEDSSKIADFLHYSVNTIYNYRAKVKNASLSDRDTFEERVKRL